MSCWNVHLKMWVRQVNSKEEDKDNKLWRHRVTPKGKFGEKILNSNSFFTAPKPKLDTLMEVFITTKLIKYLWQVLYYSPHKHSCRPGHTKRVLSSIQIFCWCSAWVSTTWWYTIFCCLCLWKELVHCKSARKTVRFRECVPILYFSIIL